MEPGVGDTSRRGDVSGVRVGCNEEEEEEEKDMFARRWNQGSAIPPVETTSLVSEWVAMRRRDFGKNQAGSPKIIWKTAIHCANSNFPALWTEPRTQ